jgi:hypothetical protein
MGVSARWLSARSAWNRPWLWDVAALLALINGGVLAQIAAEGGAGYVPLVVLGGGFGATFRAFLATDLLQTVSALDEFGLVLLGNTAVLVSEALVVAYYSQDGA